MDSTMGASPPGDADPTPAADSEPPPGPGPPIRPSPTAASAQSHSDDARTLFFALTILGDDRRKLKANIPSDSSSVGSAPEPTLPAAKAVPASDDSPTTTSNEYQHDTTISGTHILDTACLFLASAERTYIFAQKTTFNGDSPPTYESETTQTQTPQNKPEPAPLKSLKSIPEEDVSRADMKPSSPTFSTSSNVSDYYKGS